MTLTKINRAVLQVPAAQSRVLYRCCLYTMLQASVERTRRQCEELAVVWKWQETGSETMAVLAVVVVVLLELELELEPELVMPMASKSP